MRKWREPGVAGVCEFVRHEGRRTGSWTESVRQRAGKILLGGPSGGRSGIRTVLCIMFTGGRTTVETI